MAHYAIKTSLLGRQAEIRNGARDFCSKVNNIIRKEILWAAKMPKLDEEKYNYPSQATYWAEIHIEQELSRLYEELPKEFQRYEEHNFFNECPSDKDFFEHYSVLRYARTGGDVIDYHKELMQYDINNGFDLADELRRWGFDRLADVVEKNARQYDTALWEYEDEILAAGLEEDYNKAKRI